ncbi:MAG: AMP-binding protein, partial [Pseudomonadales bacterium]
MPSFARRLATERPAEIAMRDPDQALTWAQIDDTLNRAANGLHALELGAARRIAVFAENAVETGLANLSGLIAGASVVPVNFHLTAEEVAYILGDCDARVLFAGPQTLERAVAAAAQSNVSQIVAWADASAIADQNSSVPVFAWQDWLAASSDEAPPEDIAPLPNLLYTSGTTGRPKGTELPPTMFAGGSTVAEHLHNLSQSPLAALGPHLVVGPMYHTGPLSGTRLLAAGVCSTILTRFDAENTLRAIQENQIGTSIMVPTHFVRLLALPEAIKSQYDLSSLQLISHTGAKCPVDVKRAMIEWWGPVFNDAYGASEVGTTCMITSAEWLEHPGSVGRAVEPFEAMILDDDNRPVPANHEGRLFFK